MHSGKRSLHQKGDVGWDVATVTMIVTIKALDGIEDFWREASNLRELISDQYVALGKTALGRIYELMYFKRNEESKVSGRVPAKALCNKFNESVHISKHAEPVTEGFCDMAVTVFERAISLPLVREVLKTKMKTGIAQSSEV